MNVDTNLLMVLDVATKYTGYAVYETGPIEPPTAQLRNFGIFKATSKDWETRCLEMSSKISNIIRSVKPGILVQEFPYFQAGTKGMAASRSGGTIELAYLCGRISVCWEYYCAKVLADTGKKIYPVYNVKFNEWNGQLTKEITCHRCEEYFGVKANPKSIENNYADAIMMGKWFIENRTSTKVMKKCKTERIDI